MKSVSKFPNYWLRFTRFLPAESTLNGLTSEIFAISLFKVSKLAIFSFSESYMNFARLLTCSVVAAPRLALRSRIDSRY